MSGATGDGPSRGDLAVQTLQMIDRRRSSVTCPVALGLAALVLLAGCGGSEGSSSDDGGGTPVTVADRPSQVGPTADEDVASEPVEVAYGPDPLQKMDVYASTGDALGTIIDVHGGAWTGGSKGANTSAAVLSTSTDGRQAAAGEVTDTGSPGYRLVLATTRKGWDVVSIDYRLATQALRPGHPGAAVARRCRPGRATRARTPRRWASICRRW